MKEWSKHIIRWLIVVLLQVLLIDRLQIWGVCHPQVYILCLIMFPIQLPRWADMLIGAGVGLVMDIYGNCLGTHMCACIALMYARRLLIERFVSEPERISGEIYSHTISWVVMLELTAILTALHHTILILLSAWSLQHFGYTLAAIVLSSLLTILLIIGYDKIHSIS